jgi:hypothetical protein
MTVVRMQLKREDRDLGLSRQQSLVTRMVTVADCRRRALVVILLPI